MGLWVAGCASGMLTLSDMLHEDALMPPRVADGHVRYLVVH